MTTTIVQNKVQRINQEQIKERATFEKYLEDIFNNEKGNFTLVGQGVLFSCNHVDIPENLHPLNVGTALNKVFKGASSIILTPLHDVNHATRYELDVILNYTGIW